MFKGQPKGLYALALANTGERFGYYTMLAIFTLFLQAKFGFSAAVTSNIFGIFLAFVYFLPFFGGMLADRFGYGKMVTAGIIVMFFGYVFLAIPVSNGTVGVAAMIGALALIAIGTGLFKGNLQVMVGNLYDAPEYQSKRDSAFSIFYMAINIGAMFAPTAATEITKYFLGRDGLSYVPEIPSMAHQFLDGSITAEGIARYTEMAMTQGAAFTGDLTAFSNMYIEKLSGAYHWGFGVACISLVVSMMIYVFSRSTYKHADVNAKQAAESGSSQNVAELTPEQTKSRITALMLVFAVVIFFWMAFNQNGLTLTFFARDYTLPYAEGLTRIGFDIWSLTLIVVAIYGIFATIQSATTKGRATAGVITVAAVALVVYQYLNYEGNTPILPQTFQHFNPFFVVALTPVSLALFGALAKKGKEPSAPRKIGIGMFIATIGFTVMALGSLGLPTPNELADGAAVDKVSPNLLISTYLILTFAELFLSPMGISFVSKVAPPKYKGAMMGCWFASTAIGSYLVSIIGMLWGAMPLWVLWAILIILCLISAIFIFSIMKKLENATK